MTQGAFRLARRRALYDFARSGLPPLESLHQRLLKGRFHFRPGVARAYTFNGKRRVLYIYRREEKIVNQLLYRLRRGGSRASSHLPATPIGFKVTAWICASDESAR